MASHDYVSGKYRYRDVPKPAMLPEATITVRGVFFPSQGIECPLIPPLFSAITFLFVISILKKKKKKKKYMSSEKVVLEDRCKLLQKVPASNRLCPPRVCGCVCVCGGGGGG